VTNEVYNIKPGVRVHEGITPEEYQRYLKEGVPEEVREQQNENYNEIYYGSEYDGDINQIPQESPNAPQSDISRFYRNINVVGNDSELDEPTRSVIIRGQLKQNTRNRRPYPKSGTSFIDMVRQINVENQ
jgi:hypothetical protein